MWEAIRDGLARHVRDELRFGLDVLRGIFVAACAGFTFCVLAAAMRAADGHDGPVSPAIIVFAPLYFLLVAFPVYLPLGLFSGLVWPRVLAGRDRLDIVFRGAVLGLIIASVVGIPVAYGWVTKPILAGHPGEPPQSRRPVSQLIAAELSLVAPCVGWYAGWAWLASRRLDARRAKKGPPPPEIWSEPGRQKRPDQEYGGSLRIPPEGGTF